MKCMSCSEHAMRPWRQAIGRHAQRSFGPCWGGSNRPSVNTNSTSRNISTAATPQTWQGIKTLAAYKDRLIKSAGPTCLKWAIIIPVPKKNTVPEWLSPSCFNFERLILSHIQTAIPVDLDPLQFAFRENRSTEDAVIIALHTGLAHLHNTNTYVRRLFVDSAFATIQTGSEPEQPGPQQQTVHLETGNS